MGSKHSVQNRPQDFTRDVSRIDAIPQKHLETIKEWLTSVKIKYFETKMNLSWKPILKDINADPEGWVEQGGWNFLDMEVTRNEQII